MESQIDFSQNSVMPPSGPVVKRARSTSKKKSKTYTKNPTKVSIGRNPLPKQLFNTLRYADYASRTLTAGVTTVFQWSCNSLFDPNTTGVGHQPLYFDQLTAIYDHYTVLRSRFKIWVMSPSTPTSPLTYALWIDDDTSATSNVRNNSERPGAQSGTFNPGTGYMTSPLRLSWDASKAFGGNVMANNALEGSSTANPTEMQHYSMDIESIFLEGVTLQYFIEIEYDCVWTELTTIGGS